jgi:hypothetical protein
MDGLFVSLFIATRQEFIANLFRVGNEDAQSKRMADQHITNIGDDSQNIHFGPI